LSHLDVSTQCGSRKCPYPPQGGFLEITRVREGGLKAKLFKGIYV